MPRSKDVLVALTILLALYDCATCLIIPEELPTILSLIYSNIPPIKKGTDSRVGVGFRLGEHADFQVLFEIGPQTETESIGAADSKRRRDAMLGAAMRGELGPLAQAVAKYQMERKIQRELERLKRTEQKIKKVLPQETENKKTAASDWLTTWSKGMSETPENPGDILIETASPTATESKIVQEKIGRPSRLAASQQDKVANLTKLYKLQTKQREE